MNLKGGEMPIVEQDIEIYNILKGSRRVAVIGLSPDPLKAGHYVPKTLKEKGFELYGVNPKYEGQEILGIKVYGSLRKIEPEIDVVVVFRPSKEMPEIAREAVLKGFKTFWMQPGTVNEEVKEDLDQKGFNVIAGRCMKIESERLLKDESKKG